MSRMKMEQNVSSTNLKFAALTRVSTEKQEKKGESLNTQKESIKKDASIIGGDIVEWYGGKHEHATPGYERRELDRLLDDAQRKPEKFNAVIVFHADRWSRDNVKSTEGLDIFRINEIRFFTGAVEHDLFDPDDCFYLEMSATVGKYHARHQAKNSIINRINRAKQNIPSNGKLPYGRTYSKEHGWGLDQKCKELIENVAKRYLNGESIKEIAEEYKMTRSYLYRILNQRSGNTWRINFNSKALRIKEEVTLTIPPLLDEKLINEVKAKSVANRTYQHGQIKNRYLLGRMIFCAHCGYALIGQTNAHGIMRYRHTPYQRTKQCNRPNWHSSVRADDVEEIVVRHIFETLGNPTGVQKAIEKATPDLNKIKEFEKITESLEGSLEKLQKGKKRIINLVKKCKISEKEAETELDDVNEQITNQNAKLIKIKSQLENRPTQKEIKLTSKKVASVFRKLKLSSAKRTESARHANHSYEEMTWQDKRDLLEYVFSGLDKDDNRLGVYITFVDSKGGPYKWEYKICGQLIEKEGFGPMTKSRRDAHFPNTIINNGKSTLYLPPVIRLMLAAPCFAVQVMSS